MSDLQKSRHAPPPFRRLRAFAFDPSLNTNIETAVINAVTLKVPWESLQPGPVGEYLEVVDVDPASGACYEPAVLDDPHLLAQDGLSPSEGNPQFHQQMVYAVASTTIENFEQVLGRRVLWSVPDHQAAGPDRYGFVPRLRIYPHALREANAYYSPAKKALLFGYFPASFSDPGNNLPGGMVFTCLSHDIIAHEVTHALLESLHPRFIEPSNVDVLALHEAFADIVALFQHFSHSEVLRHQIARTRGDLGSENLLAELAQQFGQAIGGRGALRSALGGRDPQTGQWRRKEPDPTLLSKTSEPHARGAILLAAVFDAFLTIYKRRIADLMRIATGGSGVLPPGEIHPDLVIRLSDEAAKSAGHILRMCIRALEYCPPVDITFGDYLRAMITADYDLVPEDEKNYRLAVIEAFRRHGIYPLDVRSLSEKSLLWQPPSGVDESLIRKAFSSPKLKRDMAEDWPLNPNRQELFERAREDQRQLQKQLVASPDVMKAFGLTLNPQAAPSIYRSRGLPALEVHSVRPTYRVGPTGHSITDLVVEITQRRRGYYDPETQRRVDAGEIDPLPDPDFIFRGGATLLLHLRTGEVRYVIGKGITSQRRLEAQRRFLAQVLSPTLRVTYFGDSRQNYFAMAGSQAPVEPFALLHRFGDAEEVV